MNGNLKALKWVKRIHIPNKLLPLIGFGVVLCITVFKLKPYFRKDLKIVVYGGKDPLLGTVPQGWVERYSLALWPRRNKASPGTDQSGRAGDAPARASRSSAKKGDRAGVIERPLFDNLSVILKGTLLNSLSSESNDLSIQAQVNSGLPDATNQDLDFSSVLGAKLTGLATPNFGMKRMGLNFSELITIEGRVYTISGVAIDPESHTIGVPANYSSGLGTRLLGVGINRVILAGDQILTARILERTTDNSNSAKAVQTAAADVNQQSANSIAGEATQSLRNTRPSLSLDAGTPITLRIKAIMGGYAHE